MKINASEFRVREGHEVNLKKRPTLVAPIYKSKEQYQTLLGEHVAELSSQQQLLYASNRHAVLLIFQAMDAAGKDGAIRHVMSGVNPQGCQVFSFKHPSAGELQHDFLWRTTRDLPERGRIGIFNRSYYEEVLIARVHPEILAGEGIPDAPHDDKTVWCGRYRSIVNLERHLHTNGTRIIKFFLHLSEGEQRKRFLARIDEPEKNWKFSNADIEERKFWKHYMKAYEQCLGATSTGDSPWYVVPGVFASELLLRDDPVTHLRPLSARPLSRGSCSNDIGFDLNQDLGKFWGDHERRESEWELDSRNVTYGIFSATPKKRAK